MIHLVFGDITKVSTDVIVNAANTSLLGGGGVDGAIHRAGGPEILEECRKIRAAQGGCKTGEAVITTAGKLKAKAVVHTVGPVWQGGSAGEPEALAACYRNSLLLAKREGYKSVAFPNISTGVYRYPKEEAAIVALAAVKEFLEQDPGSMEVSFVCFDQESHSLYERLLEVKG